MCSKTEPRARRRRSRFSPVVRQPQLEPLLWKRARPPLPEASWARHRPLVSRAALSGNSISCRPRGLTKFHTTGSQVAPEREMNSSEVFGQILAKNCPAREQSSLAPPEDWKSLAEKFSLLSWRPRARPTHLSSLFSRSHASLRAHTTISPILSRVTCACVRPLARQPLATPSSAIHLARPSRPTDPPGLVAWARAIIVIILICAVWLSKRRQRQHTYAGTQWGDLAIVLDSIEGCGARAAWGRVRSLWWAVRVGAANPCASGRPRRQSFGRRRGTGARGVTFPSHCSLCAPWRQLAHKRTR